MRIKGSDLKKIIREEIGRSIGRGRILEQTTPYNIDAGEFEWPGPKPWWANSAVAHGRWEKDENIIYDLVEKFKELDERFDEEVEKYRGPTGTVTPGDMEVEEPPRGLFGALGKKRTSSAVQPASAEETVLPSSIALFRQLTNMSDLRYGSQAMFANIADRLFIVSELKKFDPPKFSEFWPKLSEDIDFLVDVDSFGGPARRGIVLSACQAHNQEQQKLILRFNDHYIYYDKGGFEAEARPDVSTGDITGEVRAYEYPEEYVWTLPEDTTYQYRMINGKWHAKRIGSAGKYIDLSSRPEAVRKLQSALDNRTLEANPMYSSEEESGLTESRRRKLFRF